MRPDRAKLGVSDLALAASRHRVRTNPASGQLVNDPFKPYQPPASVMGKAKLAFDDNTTSSMTWAFQALGSASLEGMTWIGYPELSLLAQRPEYRRASEVISTEMTREWIELSASIAEADVAGGEGEGEEDQDNPLGIGEEDEDEDPEKQEDETSPQKVKLDKVLGKDFSGPDQDEDQTPDVGEKPGDEGQPGEGDTPDVDSAQQQAQAKKNAKIKELEAELTRLKVREAFQKAALYDGLFGRSHIFIELENGGTDNPKELPLPIGTGAPDDEMSNGKVGKGSIKAFKVVEPVWAYPNRYNSSDPLSDNWFKPETWNVMAKEVHASRFLTFVGREVPDLLKPAYAFGGLSLTQMLRPYVDNWLRIRQDCADGVHNFCTIVLATDMSSLDADGSQFEKRITHFINTSNNKGVLAVDKGKEELTKVSMPLSGLSDLQSQAQEHVSAVAGIPIIKYWGIAPAGMNASSEDEIRVFYDWINAYQEHLFRANLQTIIWFVMRHLWGEVDEDIVAKFVPLYELTELEKAELRAKDAETDGKYVDMGALDPVEVREEIARDPESRYSSIDVTKVPEDPMDQEMELKEKQLDKGLPIAGPGPGMGGMPGGGSQPGGGGDKPNPFGGKQ